MRYSASEKNEIIQLVERSDLSVRKTLAHLDIHRSTFYNWLRRYRDEGVDELEDMKPVTDSAWNKIPAAHRTAIIDLALAEPQLSPRELAVTYTDDKAYFVSESSVYRLLKAKDLITSPAYILMQASDKFQHPSARVNELWQTDFTYFKIIGWGWYYLSTVLDDYLGTLGSLANSTPSTANAAAYANPVRNKAIQREVIRIADKTRNQAMASDADASLLVCSRLAVVSL